MGRGRRPAPWLRGRIFGVTVCILCGRPGPSVAAANLGPVCQTCCRWIGAFLRTRASRDWSEIWRVRPESVGLPAFLVEGPAGAVWFGADSNRAHAREHALLAESFSEGGMVGDALIEACVVLNTVGGTEGYAQALAVLL